MTQPLPITAIVVSRNEAHHLDECLGALRDWCDELLVVDMDSTDSTARVARRFADRVLYHDPSPIVEPVRAFAAAQASNDWLLFVDPDERYPHVLADDIAVALRRHANAGIIRLPMHYYFKRRRLTCTAWGKPVHFRPALVNRRRCEIRPLILRGFALRPGYDDVQVAPGEGNAIKHYWMDSYAQLIGKHVRYARQEGRALASEGGRFGVELAIARPLRELKRNLVDRGGLRGGVRGILLSLVYSGFLALSAMWLLLEQHRRPPAPQPSTAAPIRRHAA
jgi:glycosyltransferase involved in cell wall biosynthesis